MKTSFAQKLLLICLYTNLLLDLPEATTFQVLAININYSPQE